MISLSNYLKEFQSNNIQIIENTDFIHLDDSPIVKIYDDINFQNTHNYPNKHFFQRNCVEADNVHCLPLGINHNELNIQKTIDKNLDKSILCSSQYTKSYRQNIPKFDFVTYFENESNEKYLENISKSKYVISPHGIFPDCYRHWESLYLSAIPITIKHPKLDSFNDLPILFLNSWDELSEELLIKEYDMIINKSREKLNIEYWINKVKEFI